MIEVDICSLTLRDNDMERVDRCLHYLMSHAIREERQGEEWVEVPFNKVKMTIYKDESPAGENPTEPSKC